MRHALTKLAQGFAVAPMRLNSTMMIRCKVVCIWLADVRNDNAA
jgi:hypothetical protein